MDDNKQPGTTVPRFGVQAYLRTLSFGAAAAFLTVPIMALVLVGK